jgi:hypothetical protein
MRRLLAAAIVGSLAASGCGGSHGNEHPKAAEAAQPAPTPDTTPIRDLRTPAGIALARTEPPAAPSPAPTATPAAAAASPRNP